MAVTDVHTNTRRDLAGHGSRFNAMDWIATVLMIVGGLNWGLVGAFDFDLVAALFGAGSALSRAVYILVGLAALWGLYTMSKFGSRGASSA